MDRSKLYRVDATNNGGTLPIAPLIELIGEIEGVEEVWLHFEGRQYRAYLAQFEEPADPISEGE